MKVVVIHGSMRKGNTYQLTEAVLKELRRKKDVEIQEFFIKDLKLPFCLSCHQCFVKGADVCPHRDIMAPVEKAIKSCDGLIMSGVVYSMHLNAATKNFIDHFSYFFHRPRLFDKAGMVVTTTAGAGERTVAKYLRNTMGVWGVAPIEMVCTKIRTEKFSLLESQQEMVHKKAKRFYQAMKQKNHRGARFYPLMIYSSFRGMSSVKHPISQYDKNYWEKTGMVHKTYPRRLGPVKKAMGNMVYLILRKVMSR